MNEDSQPRWNAADSNLGVTTRQPDRPNLRHDLRLMMIDVAFYGLMVGVGETYFQAFAVQVGATDTAAGLIATVPLLGGAILQLISPRGVSWIGSYRKWVILCAMLQAVAFIPLVIGALAGRMPTSLIFVIATVYWGAALATGPAWNTWVGSIVPAMVKPRFFARHARMAQVTILIGIIGAGVSLELGKNYDVALSVFAFCFLLAAIARTASFLVLAKLREPLPPSRVGHRRLSVMEIVRRFSAPSFLSGGGAKGDAADQSDRPSKWEGRAIVYFIVMMAAVQIANPFLIPFILRKLELNYARFTTLIAVVFVAKGIALPIFGAVAKRYGPKRLLWIGGTMVIPLPALWMVSSSFPYLIALQVAAGVAAAAYEFGVFLLFFETIHERDRTSILTLFNLGNALAGIGGSLAGGLLLRILGEEPFAYYTIFIASTVARALAILFLIRLSGIRLTPVPTIVRIVGVRIVGVRIGLGSIVRPLLDKSEARAHRRKE